VALLGGVAPAQDRLIAQDVEAVASLYGLRRPACQARVEDRGVAAIEVRPEFQVAGETGGILSVIPPVADLADDESRPPQGEIDAVTVIALYRGVAVVAATIAYKDSTGSNLTLAPQVVSG
jgi:hypothetical protein